MECCSFRPRKFIIISSNNIGTDAYVIPHQSRNSIINLALSYYHNIIKLECYEVQGIPAITYNTFRTLHSVVLYFTDCADVLSQGNTESGIYYINVSGQTLQVWCDLDTDSNQAWTVIQRRLDGGTDFFRCWNDYRTGFGDLEGEFWIGALSKICSLFSRQYSLIKSFDLSSS